MGEGERQRAHAQMTSPPTPKKEIIGVLMKNEKAKEGEREGRRDKERERTV